MCSRNVGVSMTEHNIPEFVCHAMNEYGDTTTGELYDSDESFWFRSVTIFECATHPVVTPDTLENYERGYVLTCLLRVPNEALTAVGLIIRDIAIERYS